MCAQFVLKVEANELSKKFGIKIPEKLHFDGPDTNKVIDNSLIDIRVRGFIKTDFAPVLIAEQNKLSLKPMMYSLCPSWSKEFPYKWSTYNARMERPKIGRDSKPILNPKGKPIIEYIYEVPTWRDSFAKAKTCLVPMNAAIESSYFGTHAGEMVRFSINSGHTFYCVGLWDEWVDQSTGEVKNTFALITDNPYEFFFKAGHDRSVFVINENAIDEWLMNKKFKPKERFDFLRNNRTSLDWKVATEREMAKGWQKRVPTEEEIASTKVWKETT